MLPLQLPRLVFIFAVLIIAADAVAEKPNVILIVADDLGWTGLGCYGSNFYETPNINRLASQGVRFTRAYSAASTCAPSRGSIMSGQYTPRHGILYVGPGDYQDKYKAKTGNLKKFQMLQPRGKTELSPEIETLAATVKESGYRTGMFGKWHLGRAENHPSQRGFDVAIESHGKHFGFHTDPELEHAEDQYLSDFLSNHAASFIRKSVELKRPFFLYYADFLVHKPFEAKERYLDHFRDKQPSETQQSPIAGAMIKSLDDSVGKILDAVNETGQTDNTLVIFTSDNGGLSYEEDGLREENTSNLPLRGRKGSEYEGGIRVPWIARWPGQVPAGGQCDTPIHQVDLHPTIVTLTGSDMPRHQLDGIDLMPLFRRPGETKIVRSLFWYLPGYSAFHEPSVIVRNGDWKLIRRLETGDLMLFNTTSEIGERTNLASQHSEIADRLSSAATEWLSDTDAPRMIPNPEYAPLSR